MVLIYCVCLPVVTGTPDVTTWTANATDAVEMEDCPPHHEPGRRYPVAQFDYAYVEVPLVVSAWILFVSVAKLGKRNAKQRRSTVCTAPRYRPVII